MLNRTRTIRIRWLILLLAAAVPALGALPAQASTYGSGTYGSCPYSSGCAGSSSTSSGAASSSGNSAAAPAAPGQILLNDFSDYTSSGGKDLSLSAAQIIYFDISQSSGVVRHSVTVQDIGPDYVDLVIQSTPMMARLNLGQSEQFDVNGDGQNDIQITLNSIAGGQAQINFRALGAAVPSAVPTAASSTSSSSHLKWWLAVGFFALCLIVGIGILVWLRRQRHRPPATISTNQPSQ